jgi:branched-chain amino acid transport system permease protein
MVAFGALAGLMHVVSPRLRTTISSAVAWALTVALLEAIVNDAFDEVKLGWLSSWAYDINGGLKAVPAIVVALLAGLLSYRFAGTIPKVRTAYAGLNPQRKLRVSVVGVFMVLALFIGLPLIVGGIINELLANVGLFLLMALGLNIVVGLAGLLDLGYVAFFAVGAYGMAVLTSPLSPKYAPALSFWVALPLVVLLAAIAGLMVGTPVLRMRGDYLAIVTLGFGEIVRILFLSDWLSPVLGGAQGITRIPLIELGPWEIKGSSPISIFYLVAVFVVLAIYVSWRLQNSRIGRAWTAMREDEDVALAMGINTVSAKLLAFVTGAVLASFGGAIFAAKVGTVFPNSFSLLVSIIVLVVVIVGGMGNIPGVIVGAVVLIGVLGGPTQPGLLQEFQEFKLLIYGVLLVYMMLKRPEGLVPSAMRSRELHHEEYTQDAWLQTEAETADPEGSTG